MCAPSNPELIQCMTWILHEFTEDDLKSCLSTLKCESSKSKMELQTTLLSLLLTSQTGDQNVKKVIYNQAYLEGYQFHVEEVSNDNKVLPDLLSIIRNFPESYDRINQKRLYFHKDIKRISGWKLAGSHNMKQPIIFRFLLPDYFCDSLYYRMSHNFYPVNLLLRCTRIINDKKIVRLESCYPRFLKLFINGREFSGFIPREINLNSKEKINKLPIPTILNNGILKFRPSFSKTDRKPITIELRYDVESNKDSIFGFAIFTSVSRDHKSICQDILKKGTIKIETFYNEYTKVMSKMDSSKHLEISLISSINNKRIQIPFRGMKCDHLNPEDLDSYIKFNMKNELWLCTICKKSCTPDDIFIDEFFVKILEKHPTVGRITICDKLNYTLYGDNKLLSIFDE
uniref:SP-RING-type domain-containing protein n=1 Tax=Strongyloides stercoralis TaxID=6248 RepID=A0A0K0DZN2_STRER